MTRYARKLTVTVICLTTVMLLGACAGGTEVVIASGGTGSLYYSYSSALIATLGEKLPGADFLLVSSGSSEANARLLAEGKAQLALIRSDILESAVTGQGAFPSALEGLSAIAGVYNELCYVVARPHIVTVADLAGLRVAVGERDSAELQIMTHILSAYGLNLSDIDAQYLSYAESAAEYAQGRIDAFFCMGGIPAAALVKFAAENSIKMLVIDDDRADALISAYPYYSKFTISKTAYDGVGVVQTLAVKAVLAASSSLSDDLVYQLTKSMFAESEVLYENVTAGMEPITMRQYGGKPPDVEYALAGITIPLHPGAQRYYNEAGEELEYEE